MPTTKSPPVEMFFASPQEAGPRLRVPAEPWYYGSIDGLARFLLAICSILIAVAVAGGVLTALYVLGRDAVDPFRTMFVAVATLFLPILLTAASLISTLILALLLRLGVDVARNVRALRYGR